MHDSANGLDQLRLSAATRAVLDRAHIASLAELTARSPADLCAIPSLRSPMLTEVVEALRAHGAPMAPDEPMPGSVDLEWDLDWAQRGGSRPSA